MKNRNLRGMVMGLLATSAILSGCSMIGLRNFSELTRQNNARIMTLQRGMTPEQVIEHIGPSGNSQVPNPFRSEVYPAGDDTFRAFFFYAGTGYVAMGLIAERIADPTIQEGDLMPVVFKNEHLDGWGWSYWKSTVEQYNIRIGNR